MKIQLNKVKELVKEYHNKLLPTREYKFVFWGVTIIASLIAWYVIAWIDTMNAFGSGSLPAITAYYIVSDAKFPFGIWLMTLVFLDFVILAAVKAVKRKLMADDEEGRNFEISDSDVYGNSREINEKELKTICEIKEPIDTTYNILGMAPNSDTKVLSAIPKAMPNGNVAVFGTPGSGKTFTECENLIVQCIRRRESVVTTDTKGDLWANTAEFARDNGCVVRRLDLRKPAFSYGWQALKEMRMDGERAQIFATIVVENCNIAENYKGFVLQLLKAVCLYVERSPAISSKERTFGTVYRMISREATSLNSKFEAAKAEVENHPELEPALEAYGSFQMASGPLAGNIINNLSASLGIMSTKSIQNMLEADEIDLELPGKTPCTYYVSMSDQTDSMKFIASLFFSFLILDLVDLADAQPGQKLKVPCTILLEEMAQVKIPDLDKKLSTCRSRGISIVMILQTISQIKKDYKDAWSNMLGDCAILKGIGFNDMDTAEEFSKRIGDATVKVQTDQHSRVFATLFGSDRYSTGDGRRQYRSANDLMKMKPRHCIILWQHYDSLMTRTFGIDRNPAYPYMRHILTTTKVPLNDYCAKQIMRQLEERRVEIMNEWIEQGGSPMWYVHNPVPEDPGPAYSTIPPQFMSYDEMEELALQYSQDHPEINRELEQQRRADKIGFQLRQKDGVPKITILKPIRWLSISQTETPPQQPTPQPTQDSSTSQAAPATEPVSAPPKQQPATEPVSAPPKQQPAPEPVSAPPKQQPATEPVSAPPKQQPAPEPVSAPPKQQPATKPVSAPPKQQPATKPVSAPPKQQPVVTELEHCDSMPEYEPQDQPPEYDYNRDPEIPQFVPTNKLPGKKKSPQTKLGEIKNGTNRRKTNGRTMGNSRH